MTDFCLRRLSEVNGKINEYLICLFHREFEFNGWQLAKMKKSIPDMSLP